MEILSAHYARLLSIDQSCLVEATNVCDSYDCEGLPTFPTEDTATDDVAEFVFPRDPKDSMFLTAANATDAEFLLTGDKDFQDARRLSATRIVTVADFAKLFKIP